MNIYLFVDDINIAPSKPIKMIANLVWYNDARKVTNGQVTWRRIGYVLHSHDYEACKNREENRCKYLDNSHYEVAPCVDYVFDKHGSSLLKVSLNGPDSSKFHTVRWQ